MTDLGTLGGSSSGAYGVNSSGKVVGSADTAAGVEHAFPWQNGVVTDLGMPPGFQSAGAIAISDNGKIAGWGFGPIAVRRGTPRRGRSSRVPHHGHRARSTASC